MVANFMKDSVTQDLLRSRLRMGHCHSLSNLFTRHPIWRDEEKSSTLCWEELKIILKRTWIQKVVRILCHFYQTTQFAIGQDDGFQVSTEKIDLSWRQQQQLIPHSSKGSMVWGISTEAEKCLHIDFCFVNGLYFKSCYFVVTLLLRN